MILDITQPSCSRSLFFPECVELHDEMSFMYRATFRELDIFCNCVDPCEPSRFNIIAIYCGVRFLGY